MGWVILLRCHKQLTNCWGFIHLALHLPSSNLNETLDDTKQKIISSEVWSISVICKRLISTAMEQFHEADDEDWSRMLKVEFLDEDAVDSGGPFKEIFSLLFRKTPLLCGTVFQHNVKAIQKKDFFWNLSSLERQQHTLSSWATQDRTASIKHRWITCWRKR